MNSPLFSIIVPHYQWDGKNGIRHEDFLRGLTCIQDQTFTDYEVLVYHDGPPTDKSLLKECPFPVQYTEKRYNDWGHSLRDAGIKNSKGDYIVHFNPDNILYPNALEKIAEAIHDTTFEEVCEHVKPGDFTENPSEHAKRIKNIVVFPIYLYGVKGFGQFLVDFRPLMEAPKHKKFMHLLSGYPVLPGFIDAMQVVVKRSLWLQEGGWSDKSEKSDGKLLERLVIKNIGCAHIFEPLGEHY